MTNIEARIGQLQHQSNTWKRDIEFLIHENVVLKNRLAEILSDKQVTPEFMERVEAYQNDFIAKDEAIRLIRGEIFELDKLLFKGHSTDGKALDEKLIATQKKFSREVEAFTKDFIRLKFDFNNYMSEILINEA